MGNQSKKSIFMNNEYKRTEGIAKVTKYKYERPFKRV